MATAQVSEHIARMGPPWRIPVLSECGKALAKVTWISRDQAREKRRSLADRAAICGTCVDAMVRWGGDWDGDPAAVVARDVLSRWETPQRRQLRIELYALAELARRHSEEFAALAAQFGAPPPARQRTGLRVVRHP